MSNSSNTPISSKRRESTLDVICSKIQGIKLENAAQTGDILLSGTTDRDRSHWFRVVYTVGGKAAMESRLRLVHCSVIIRDPPSDVLALYGLSKSDGNAFVLESTSHHAEGCRLFPLDAYLAKELNPAFVGTKVVYRRRTSDNDTNDEALWDWLRKAKDVPYPPFLSIAGMEQFYNWCFVPGCFKAMLDVCIDLGMVKILKAFGDGPFGHLLCGLLGLAFIMTFTYLFWSLSMVWVVLLNLPYFLAQGKICRTVMPVDKDGFPATITCSTAVAETLVHAGLLTRDDPTCWYVPRFFLPQNIVSDDNLMDANLAQGVTYSSSLFDVTLEDPYAPKNGLHFDRCSIDDTDLEEEEDVNDDEC